MAESRLDYALNYSAIGWPVIPLHFITPNGCCSCNTKCKSPGKHPIIAGGFKAGSTDPIKIQQWFTKYPQANIGIITGAVSGILALDIDPRHGGEDSFDAIVTQYGRVPDAILAVTGSGGRHYLFKYPGKDGRSTTNLWPGIDTRGDGGYIVGAPSNHISGGAYFWDAKADPLMGAILPDTPDWLLSKLAETNRTTATAAPTTDKVLPPGEVKRIRAALSYLPADDRDQWRTVGMALHASGAGDQAFGLWCEWSGQSDKFDLKDQRRVWNSFKTGGGITLAAIFGMAKQNGWIQPEPDRQPGPPLSVYAADVAATGQRSTMYNAILDDEQRYSTVELLKFLPSDHMLKRFSLEVAQVTWLPEATVFLMGLAVFSSMAARRYCVLYQDQTRLPIGLYVVAEQPPGTGKSRCLRLFQAPFYNLQKDACADTTKEIKVYEKKSAAPDSLSVDEAENYTRLTDSLKRLNGILFVSNATPEALEKTLNDTKGFFAAVSSEQGLFNVLFGATYKPGDHNNNNDVVLNGFDGGHMGSARVTRQGYIGPVVGGVACFAQAGTVERLMTASNGTGLAERFLALTEAHALGRRNHKKRSIVSTGIKTDYQKACGFFAKVLNNPKDFSELDCFEITDEGFDMIADYRNQIEPHLADGGLFGHVSLRGAVSKVDMQILKLAGNLYLTSGADKIGEIIPDAYVVCAIDMAKALVTANLQLCRDKGLIGIKAEFSAILTLFERDPRPRSARNILQTTHKTKPFCEFTGSKSALIKQTLQEMVTQQLLSVLVDGRKTMFTLAQ